MSTLGTTFVNHRTYLWHSIKKESIVPRLIEIGVELVYSYTISLITLRNEHGVMFYRVVSWFTLGTRLLNLRYYLRKP